ncbi:heterokaryon incompatibility protein-domain-containing protein [Cercophora samala]|uniref:Heterokaryon incompatibility protein-domain-containing protein n=1 Tax=Cercophora samala TaxID=330535 RepID=A0AA39ZEQ8_9PEZI|nr:heterokaryon incompatibility protein-domain-containing protein [Cercophora samala]
MNVLDSDEILKRNDKITSFVLVNPNQVDDDDVDIFVVKAPGPPPPAAHLNQTTAASPAISHGSNLGVTSPRSTSISCMTRLCDTCSNAMNYFGHYLDVLKSKGEEAVENLPAACLLHSGAKTLQDGEDSSCHVCVFLMANLRVKRLAMESIDQSNIEMCWQSGPSPKRLHFALTHQAHPRSAKNYWNILKLQIWPSSEFDKTLFGMRDGGGMERHSSTKSEQTRDNAIEWLKRCQANEDGKHDQCNTASADWLPTRLLDVKSAIETSMVKLVMSSDTPDAFILQRQYVTLSHCWGNWGASRLPVLTTGNIVERLQEGVPISLLPKTFVDAIQVASWFKVRWLWIDSLCIIQDSKEDWQRESIMMYDVYKNALLNISADDSPDGRFGCFRDRDPLAVLPMNVSFRGQESWKCWLTPDTHAVFDSITKSSLAKRGWVFQERQLSRRVLHFTSHELMWECCAEAPYFASETFPGGTPFKVVFNRNPKFQTRTSFKTKGNSSPELYNAWNTICREYSGRIFSHVQDKLVALSGLAQEFEVALPDDTYLAGIWRSTLPQSLLWKSSDRSSPAQSTGNYLAPSWSWLSIDGPVSPSYIDQSGSDTAYSLVDIVDAVTTPLFPAKPTASLKDASITLRCFLRPVEIRPDYEKKPWYLLAMGGGKAHKLLIKDEDGTESFRVSSFDPSSTFDFSFDTEWDQDMESGPEAVAGYFVPLTMVKPTEHESLCVRGLLVEPIGADRQTKGTYRRIGLLSVYGSHCQRVKYKVKNKSAEDSEQADSWERLVQSLQATHQSFEELARNVERQLSVSGERVSKSASDAGNEETEESAIDEDVTEQLEALDIVDGGHGVAQIDLATVDATERLYALDVSMDRELESLFERLALQTITLI